MEAEEGLIGSLLIDEDVFLEVQPIVEIQDFYRERHQWIYEALSALHARGCGFNPVTILDELVALERVDSQNRADYGAMAVSISEITTRALTSHHAIHHARIVRRLGVTRRLIGAAKQIERLAYETTGNDLDALLVEAEAILWEVTQERAAGQGPRPLAELLPASEERLVQMSESEEPIGIPAVPESFNRLIGGWQPGKVYIPAAYTGGGKTSFMLANGKAAADKGHDTLIFTLEMIADELIQKLAGSEGRIDSQLLGTGPIDGATLKSAQRAIKRMSERTHLWIDDTSGLTWLDMMARAKRVKMALQRQGRDLELIIVDYLQYMTHIHRKGSNDAAAIAGTMMGLKSIAKGLHVPIIVASQLNRDGAKDNRKPILQDLRESGAIEQEGDGIIFIYYPDKDNLDEQPDLILAKMRGGRTGVRSAHFDKALNIWRDISHQAEPQGYSNGNGRHHESTGEW